MDNELGELLAGKWLGRTDEREITFFQNNGGRGIADLALAIRYYELAKGHGLGEEIGRKVARKAVVLAKRLDESS